MTRSTHACNHVGVVCRLQAPPVRGTLSADTPSAIHRPPCAPFVKRLDATGTSRHRAVTTAGRLHPPRRGSCAECPPPSARHRPPCHTPFVRVTVPAPNACATQCTHSPDTKTATANATTKAITAMITIPASISRDPYTIAVSDAATSTHPVLIA